jgi:hypothetical protein
LTRLRMRPAPARQAAKSPDNAELGRWVPGNGSGPTSNETMRKPILVMFLFLPAGARAQAHPAVWQPAPGHVQEPIWPGKVPDAMADPRPESVGPPRGGKWWPRVNDVSRPTLTVYGPKGRNTGGGRRGAVPGLLRRAAESRGSRGNAPLRAGGACLRTAPHRTAHRPLARAGGAMAPHHWCVEPSGAA